MTSCRPHYLPREFSCVLLIAVYLPPQTNAGTKTALNKLFKAISKQENAHPEALLLVAGDFNAGKHLFAEFLPECHMCNQRKKNLDHLYSTHRDEHKTLPHPAFGKSDHNSVFFNPVYKHKPQQEVSVTRSIRTWSDSPVA